MSSWATWNCRFHVCEAGSELSGKDGWYGVRFAIKPSLVIVVGCVLALAALTPKVGQAQVFDGELAGQGVVRVITGGGWGTGFIINDQGYVITNWHVVYDHRNGRYASDLSVILNKTQEQIPVTLIMASSELDFAIVKAQSSLGRPSVPLATVTPKPGGGVFLVGYPGVAISFKGSPNVSSTSAGVVSRVIMGDWGRGGNFPLIQHTSEANPGNSGGPLFDSCGRVIGIHTQSPKVWVVDGGRVRLVPAGAGIFFASHVVITMSELKSRGIPFDEQTEVCIPPAGGIMEDPKARAQAEQAIREAAIAKAASIQIPFDLLRRIFAPRADTSGTIEIDMPGLGVGQKCCVRPEFLIPAACIESAIKV